MSSEAFAANLAGFAHDPDDLVARHRAGAANDDRLRLPKRPPTA
jgi:hypothetical protein